MALANALAGLLEYVLRAQNATTVTELSDSLDQAGLWLAAAVQAIPTPEWDANWQPLDASGDDSRVRNSITRIVADPEPEYEDSPRPAWLPAGGGHDWTEATQRPDGAVIAVWDEQKWSSLGAVLLLRAHSWPGLFSNSPVSFV